MRDDQRPTEGDSRARGTREPLQQATEVQSSWCAVKTRRRRGRQH